MPWLQFSFALSPHTPEAVEALLEELGAVAVSLLEGDGAPVLEPAPGETPLWDDTRVCAMFEADADEPHIRASLGDALGLTADQLSSERLEDRVWEREWMVDFEAMRFGQRLWIRPSGLGADIPADAVVVELDPGLAFGTGTHPTTALCLQWLDGEALAGRRLIDYGCGSGVLALAALALGAEHVVCVDKDPQALEATAENAARNGMSSRIDVCAPEQLELGSPVDMVLANILAGPLVTLAPRLAELTAAGGALVLSGLTEAQSDEVIAAYRPWFHGFALQVRDDWVRISAVRKGATA